MKGLLLPGVAAEDKCELKSTSRPICVGGFISFEPGTPQSLCPSPLSLRGTIYMTELKWLVSFPLLCNL